MRSIFLRAASISPRHFLIILTFSSSVPGAQAGPTLSSADHILRPGLSRDGMLQPAGGTQAPKGTIWDDGLKPVAPQGSKGGIWDDGQKPVAQPDTGKSGTWDDGHKPAPGVKTPVPK